MNPGTCPPVLKLEGRRHADFFAIDDMYPARPEKRHQMTGFAIEGAEIMVAEGKLQPPASV